MCTDSPTADRDAIRVLPKFGANESPQEQPEEHPRVAEDKIAKTSTTDLIVPRSSSKEISVVKMKTETREKLSTPIVLSSTGEGEDAPNTSTNGASDMDTQEGVVQRIEKGEVTSNPEAIKIETGVMEHLPENSLQEGPSTNIPLVQTTKMVLWNNTRPLRDCLAPRFLGERFFTSAVTMETQGINVVTAKDTSDEDLNVLPQAASGMTITTIGWQDYQRTERGRPGGGADTT